MSDPVLLEQIMVAAGMGLLGAVVFAAIGLVSGTDETTTLAPLTLLVVLLGVPPAGVFTFFLAGAVAKHMTHAVPTALLGIPGDTLATPLLQDANMLRKLGVPHIALRKMVSGAIVAAFVAVPLAVLFAVLLAPFGGAITKSAPWIFLAAAVLIAYFSAGRWAAVALLVPFVAWRGPSPSASSSAWPASTPPAAGCATRSPRPSWRTPTPCWPAWAAACWRA